MLKGVLSRERQRRQPGARVKNDANLSRRSRSNQRWQSKILAGVFEQRFDLDFDLETIFRIPIGSQLQISSTDFAHCGRNTLKSPRLTRSESGFPSFSSLS